MNHSSELFSVSNMEVLCTTDCKGSGRETCTSWHYPEIHLEVTEENHETRQTVASPNKTPACAMQAWRVTTALTSCGMAWIVN
jgi:hypothetical protein